MWADWEGPCQGGGGGEPRLGLAELLGGREEPAAPQDKQAQGESGGRELEWGHDGTGGGGGGMLVQHSRPGVGDNGGGHWRGDSTGGPLPRAGGGWCQREEEEGGGEAWVGGCLGEEGRRAGGCGTADGGTTQTEAGVPSSPRHATSRQLDATSRDVAKSGHPSARPTGTRVENGHPSFRRAPELKTGTRVQPGPRQQARQGAGELPLLSSVEARAPGEIWGAQRGYHPVHTWPATETQNKGAFQGE